MTRYRFTCLQCGYEMVAGKGRQRNNYFQTQTMLCPKCGATMSDEDLGIMD